MGRPTCACSERHLSHMCSGHEKELHRTIHVFVSTQTLRYLLGVLLGPFDLYQAYCHFPLHHGGCTNCGLPNLELESIPFRFKVCQCRMGLVSVMLQVSIVILQNLSTTHRSRRNRSVVWKSLPRKTQCKPSAPTQKWRNRVETNRIQITDGSSTSNVRPRTQRQHR